MVPALSRRALLRSTLPVAVTAHLPQHIAAVIPAPQHLEPIRAQIQKAVDQGEATGVAVAVTNDGHIVWEEGFGWANREARLPVTPHTPFSLASLTKPFTTTAVMTLVNERKLSLQDPANKYLLNSKISGLAAAANQVTAQQLGAHAGGLPAMFEAYFQNQASLAPNPDQLLQAYGTLAFPPGTVYEYSNIGFAALGAIASHLTGTDIGTLITQRVLNPLALHDSFFDTDSASLQTAARRYDQAGRAIPWYSTATPASGELYASAHDLALFALFNMGGPHWLRELHKPVFTGSSGVATTFGWFRGELMPDVPVIFKTGGQPGVATLLYMVPSQRLSCLVLTNRSNGHRLTHAVCEAILASYLRHSTPPAEDAGPASTPLVLSRQIAGSWTGLLTNNGVNLPVRLQIESSQSALLTLGHQPPAKINDLQNAGTALIGNSVGIAEAPDTLRNGAKWLKLKLLPYEGKLVGRILALSGNPDSMNSILPFTLALSRPGSGASG